MKGSESCVSPRTLGALEWMRIFVGHLVLIKVSQFRKSLLADLALEWFLMRVHVLFQVHLSFDFQKAQVALINLLRFVSHC